LPQLFYLVSTAGIPNLGDEFIAATWLRYLAENHPEADVVLDCIAPERVAEPVLALHPRLRTVSVLWQICFRHWSAGVGTREIAHALVNDPSQAADLRPGIELLRQADVVHVTGGGFLNGIWPPFVGLLSGVAAAVRRSGGIAAMTGVGLFPSISGAEDLVGELTAEFDVLDVRDEPSVPLLGRRGTCTCDDAFLSPRAWLDSAEDAPEFMVSLHSTSSPARLFPPTGTAAREPSERERLARVARSEQGLTLLMAYVAKTVREWGADEIGFVESCPTADRAVWERIDQVAPKVRRYALGDILRDGFPGRPGQAWLSTRFHPHLYAAAVGASGVALSLMKGYYDTKHGSLAEAGSGWSLATYRPFDDRQEIPGRPDGGGFPPDRLTALSEAKLTVAKAIYQRG
jgi:hypothetical protein